MARSTEELLKKYQSLGKVPRDKEPRDPVEVLAAERTAESVESPRIRRDPSCRLLEISESV